MIRSFRSWRLRRAESELADAEHDYEHWIQPFRGTRPSHVARAKRRIAQAERRVKRWRVKPTTADEGEAGA